MKIEKLNNYLLLAYYDDAIRDENYNPSDMLYNDSGFTLNELREELLRRIN